MTSPASLRVGLTQVEIDRRDAFVALALAVLSALLGWQLIGGSHFDWHVPLLYGRDSLLHLVFIKRLIDGHGYFLNDAQGFPVGSELYDFPGSDGVSLAALWALGRATGSAPMALNIYYVLGFPLAAMSAYLVFRKLSVTRATSAAFSLLFALAPFHFLRLEHLYFTWYFTIPIFVWYGLRVCSTLVASRKLAGNRRTWLAWISTRGSWANRGACC
ncbi:hypothetical protein VAR608DRAFT_3481 [Variovorax sp. HW608]|nr:hypothetical protein VAR608DRAFT_3481 [Variovorax sp. HW608]